MMYQDLIGKHAIVRTYSAGVHAGIVEQIDGDKVVLANSRRLWYWHAKAGIALSGVAVHGVESDSNLDTMVSRIYLIGVIEIIPTTDAARESINGH